MGLGQLYAIVFKHILWTLDYSWACEVVRSSNVKLCLCGCSDKEAQCEVIDQMMQEIIREEFEQEDAVALAACLCQTLHSQFEPSILPQELDEELV